MNDQDRVRFIKAINSVAALFEKTLGSTVIDLYFRALEDLPIEAVEGAVMRSIQECTFFPKPAEIRHFALGSAADRSEQAWEILWQAYLKAGYWDSVLFQDGAIARTVQIVFGGWVQFSEAVKGLSDEMIQAKRKQFIATYRREALQPKEPQRLPGYHEVQNLNSVSTWTRDQFSDTYKQRVFVAQAEGGRFVDANFHRNSAQMIESEMQLLNAARLPQLPAKPKLELLPAPSDEARQMTPEQIRAQIALVSNQMAGRRGKAQGGD